MENVEKHKKSLESISKWREKGSLESVVLDGVLLGQTHEGMFQQTCEGTFCLTEADTGEARLC